MKACIYARTSRAEKGPNTTALQRQIACCRALARKHRLDVETDHVFTDVEMRGDLPPTCWAAESAPGRPALSALVEAVEEGRVSRILVCSPEALGTSSEVLCALLELFSASGVRVILERQDPAVEEDPRSRFAAAILKPCIQYDTEQDEERRAKLRARKSEELQRLQAKVARLEADLTEL